MKTIAIVRNIGFQSRALGTAAVALLATVAARATDTQIITDLTTAGTAIGGDVTDALGLGLKIGIFVIGGALAWKAFKKLTA